METKQIPAEQAIVKISTCNKCGGIVRIAMKHMLDTKRKNEFAKEVLKYNLSVKEQLLSEYRKANTEFCKCP